MKSALPHLSLTLLFFIFLGCQQSEQEAAETAPPDAVVEATPALFAEDIINTEGDEYGPALSPDGQTLYFTRRLNRQGEEHIVYSRWEDGAWMTPTVAPFSGSEYDKEPYFSLDGSKLFFASKRLVEGEDLDFEIWFVERTDAGWSAPIHLAELSSPEYENYPAVAANGNIYFSSKREGGTGANDLYRARWVDGQYQEPEPLTSLNTPTSDADPYIDPEERFMIFSSTREGGYGEGDLYLTYNRNGVWSEPQNLGTVINTTGYEYTPLISPDGQYLYFSRDWGEMYRIERNALPIAP